jgi:hypothetical protein
MKVKYVLDKEDGIDSRDLLGNISLHDIDGNSLSIEEIFVDVWLLAFLNGIFEISTGETLKIEVLEETFSVLLTKKSHTLIFKYENSIISTNFDDALSAFKGAGKKLISELQIQKETNDNPTLSSLEKLLF